MARIYRPSQKFTVSVSQRRNRAEGERFRGKPQFGGRSDSLFSQETFDRHYPRPMFPRLPQRPMCKTHAEAFRWHDNEHYSVVREARSFEGTLPRCVYLRSGRCEPLSLVSRESAKTFPIFPCRPSLPIADDSRRAVVRRPCAATGSGIGLLLSESGMSHETSLHTSRTVLMASITICSCLALVSVFRLCVDSLYSTESAHGTTGISKANQDGKRTYGEFYPRSRQSAASKTSQNPRSFPPTQQVPSTKRPLRPIQGASQIPVAHAIVVPSPSANSVETEEPIAVVDDQLVSMTPIFAPPIEMAEPKAASALDAAVSAVVPLPKPAVFSSELIALPELISDESTHLESRNQAPLLEESEFVLFPESIEQPEPVQPEPVAPGTVLTGPTSAMPPSMNPDLSAPAAANDVMVEDHFTFPAASEGTANENAADAVSATLTHEPSSVPNVRQATDVMWADHTLTQSRANSESVESSAVSDQRSVENQRSAGHASSGTANNSQRTVNPLARMRERMAVFLKAPSRPGFDRPDWMNDLGDWRERQTDAISSAARSVTIPSQTTPRNPDAHQGRTDSRSRQGFTQPESSGRTFAASFRNADPPEWIGSVRNAAAQRSAKGSQMLHRAASSVRYAAQPKTVE